MSKSSPSSSASTNSPASAASPTSERSARFDETTRTILSAIVIAMLIRMFAFEPFNIPSSSMVPSLLIGDFLFVSKYSYGYSSRSTVFGLLPIEGRLFFREPKLGDVAVFKFPRDNSTDYIKRVVGLPGDTVQVRHGLLYINGVAVQRQKLKQPVAEEYVTPPAAAVDYIETLPNGVQHVIREDGDDYPLDNTEVFAVPPRHYFMMGDNRDNSQDSRAPNGGVGYVPEDNLVGRAEFLFFSLDEHTHFWEFWKWPWAVRWDRLFKKIR
ncbi:MAG: signal peptidase I [Alphaproteobacteria bacterium]|nr:signal peptidase I [Alphaproteobacteria bacterium]